MVYKEKLCPFVCHADFECFCVKEHKHDEEDEVEHMNDSDTATSSNEPHLKKQSKPQEKLNLTMTQIVIQLILKLGKIIWIL